MNKEAIQAVREAILSYPDLYDQRIYASERNPCGTACCLAGWAVWNNDPSEFRKMAKSHGDFAKRADDLFGLRYSRALFGTGSAWPHPFAERFHQAKTSSERAKVAADLLQEIIDTDAAVLA